MDLNTGRQLPICLTEMRAVLHRMAAACGARLEQFAVSATDGYFWLQCSGLIREDSQQQLKAVAVLPLPDASNTDEQAAESVR